MLSVIIVTHNSEKLIGRCIESLDQQSLTAARIIIVDSGSNETSYLDAFTNKTGYEVHLKENIGFAAANNLGFLQLHFFFLPLPSKRKMKVGSRNF